VLDLALKGIFAHSYIPLKIVSIVGISTSLAAVFATIWTVVASIFFGVPFSGYGTIVCLILLGIGIVTLLLGFIAEYVALIYEEVKQRPNFVISERIGFL
jgi:dolichol-phosphate mannosyltransferase